MSTWIHFASKKPSKSHLGGVLSRLGRILRCFGGVLDTSRGILGASWGVSGPSRMRLGPSWRRLGSSWRRLGSSWGRLRVAALRYPARRGLGGGSTPAGTRPRRRWGEGREGGTGKKTCVCDLTRRRPEARRIIWKKCSFMIDILLC